MNIEYHGAVSPVEVRRGGNIYRFHSGQMTAVPDELGHELLQNPNYSRAGQPPVIQIPAEAPNRIRPLLIGITTAPRKDDYLLGVCKAIADADVRAAVILAPTVTSDLSLCARAAEILGPKHAQTMSVMWKDKPGPNALEINTDRLIDRMLSEPASCFLTLQDDLVFCPRALERIAQVAEIVGNRKDIGFISFYTPYQEAGQCQWAMWRYQPERFYGELAMLWGRNAADAFVKHKAHKQDLAHDLRIQEFFASRRSQWEHFGHSPCLVQHVGKASATGKPWENDRGQPRTTMNFNPNHDAIASGKPL